MFLRWNRKMPVIGQNASLPLCPHSAMRCIVGERRVQVGPRPSHHSFVLLSQIGCMALRILVILGVPDAIDVNCKCYGADPFRHTCARACSLRCTGRLAVGPRRTPCADETRNKLTCRQDTALALIPPALSATAASSNGHCSWGGKPSPIRGAKFGTQLIAYRTGMRTPVPALDAARAFS